MMECIHPHTYEKLGFDILLRWVSDRCIGEDAKIRMAEIKPDSDPAVIQRILEEASEMKEVMGLGASLPWSALVSVSVFLRKLKQTGQWLSLEDLWRLAGWMQAVQELRVYFLREAERFPHLHSLAHSHPFSQQVIKDILAIFDAHGNLRDDASPALGSIRKEIRSSMAELRNSLYRALKKAQDQGWTLDQEITIRNDRFVIPVKVEAKGRIAGFVHDVSQSGQTVFMEPAEALPLNNRVRELQLAERNEIIRILQEISEKLRDFLPELIHFQEVATQFDMLQAKTKLAIKLDAHLPKFQPEGKRTVLRGAYFPLLLLRAAEEKFQVVPLNIDLHPTKRIILISGPNAGGKSISLKTIGLLQLMLQCGFLVPASPDSEFRLYSKLFLDIGDEQSVANDLSTYTSHLFQMRQMGDQMNADSLFLIDEFGAGTDPKLGGAIAEAFLERFIRVGAYGIITTHYGNLKDFAEVNPGIGNAAMEFDTQELKPTFRMIDGLPGRSYAFEMAQRVGVHGSILRKARQKLSSDDMDSEKLLRELQEKQSKLSRLAAEAERKDQKLTLLTEATRKLKEELETNRKDLIRKAKLEAQSIVLQANKEVERAIKDIRESQAEKTVVQQVRKNLETAAPVIEPAEEKKPEKAEKGLPYEIDLNQAIVAGDWAKLRQGESYGRVDEIAGKKAVVEIGDLRMTIRLQDLVKIRLYKEPQAKVNVRLVSEGRGTRARFELDIMGMRVDEALIAVDKWLDDARLTGLNRLRLLHGKGTGALRQAVRQHLYGMPFVMEVADAPVEEGGAGWTIIQLG